MKKHTRSWLIGIVLLCFTGGQGFTTTGNVDLPRYPSISPDGSQIVFSWRGDLWLVSSQGGHATRLTTHPEDELRSVWSPAGERIAFESTRDGFQNLYMINKDGTNLQRVTELDRSCNLGSFGIDDNGNEVLSFSASLEGDVYRSPRPYMVPTQGGEPQRIHDAFGRHPMISPEGEKVAFTRGGASWSRKGYRGSAARNVWLYHHNEDSFEQLTEWDGNDGKARWSDNNTLYYLSDQQLECINLYRLQLDREDPKPTRLTSFEENNIEDFDIVNDGSTAVFVVWDTLYTLQLDQEENTPQALTITANEDEEDNYELKRIHREVSEAALSPDGKVMAFIAYGEVYVRNVEEKSPTQRITNSHAREKDIAWSPDGLKLYFVSDRDGTESIYTATVKLTRSEVKAQFDETLLVDEKEEEVEEENHKENNDEEDQECENDEDQEEEDEERELPKELDPERWHDAIQFNIEEVIVENNHDREPSPSPDGTQLAFRRGRGDLMIMDLESRNLRRLVKGWDVGLDWRWSPDSRYIAYSQNDINFNSDIWIIPADGSKKAVNITQHPDNDLQPRWSLDGKILSFISERINEEYDVWMVYLDQDLESLTPKELEQYYKDATEKAKKQEPLKIDLPKVEDEEKEDKETEELEEAEAEEDNEKPDPAEEWELDDAYLRLQRITTLEGNENNLEMTPAGDRFIFTGKTGETGLFSIKWDGTDRQRLGKPVSVRGLNLQSDQIIFVSSGRGGTIQISDGKREYIDIDDRIRIDLQKQSDQKFLEAARILGERFYHPTMKGLDWSAVTEKYHTLATQTRTTDEFNYVAARFIGELNASHLGIYARSESNPNSQAMGRLGIDHERVENGYKVTNVIPQGPAAVGPMALHEGDVITAIEGQTFEDGETVETLLKGEIGKEVLISIRRPSDEGESKELHTLLTPISHSRESQLKYKAWRLNKAKLAEEWSDGKLGYIHIQAMNQSSLEVFERDLYAAAHGKQGLLIDVRNNGGGWTTDRLLASIMVKKHAYTIPRGADRDITWGYPQDRFYLQRYHLPINMLCNENSFSNAEIISHAFKTLERGHLVGQTTFGAVISTGGTRLIDGTYVRIPFRGWYLLDGTDMEEQGAVPHIIVPQTPEAECRNEDEQLQAAVDDLLKRINEN